MKIFDKASNMFSSGADKAQGALSSPIPGTPGAGTAEVFVPPKDKPLFVLGQENRLADVNDANAAPNLMIKTGLPDDKTYEYPLGLSNVESNQHGPMMIITAFDYKRSTNRKPVTGKFPTAYNRISTKAKFAVLLPLPGNLRSSVSSEFSSLSSMINAITQVNGDANILEGAKADVKDIMSRVKADIADLELSGGALLAAGLEGAKGILQGKNITQAAGAAAEAAMKQASVGFGLSLNPMTESVYVSPTIGSHQFDFTMVPTSEAEVLEIQNIIRALKFYSTAKSALQTTSLILEYPAMFNIRFVVVDNGAFVPVQGIPTIPDCFLREMDVTFNPIGHGRLMADASPVSYRMTLSFSNIRAMTRDDLEAIDNTKTTMAKSYIPENIDGFFKRLID